ncbi:Hypothetical predicted protein [Mytilus galloprovincialis]|uniref:Uncharacterized protein n=1 Tax=Mytilus galloprovincialis TaxID=29158 RepID=A0A8B6BPV9_MYTGA|nr:Hypothetical predicted protein [Mytilus galloprovincialis]
MHKFARSLQNRTSEQEVKKEPTEGQDDVLDLHDINYIDRTDIQVPRAQEPSVQVEEGHSPMVQVEVERDLPTVPEEKGTPVPEVKAPMQQEAQQPEVNQPEVKHYDGNKHSTCPILTCGEYTKKLMHHCWVYHLPYIFKDLPLDKFEKEPSFQKLRGEAIQKLAWWIVGPRATVYDLVRYVNSNNILPRNCTMMQRCQDQMRNVTAVMNWYPLAEDIYTMYPVNSPAVLMQWRILITLLSQLSPARRAEFRRIGSDFVLPPMARQQPPVKRKAETAVRVPVAKS